MCAAAASAVFTEAAEITHEEGATEIMVASRLTAGKKCNSCNQIQKRDTHARTHTHTHTHTHIMRSSAFATSSKLGWKQPVKTKPLAVKV